MGCRIRRGLILAAVTLAACTSAPKAGRPGAGVDRVIADLENGDLSRRVNGLIAARYLGDAARPALKPMVRLLFEPGAEEIDDGSYVLLAQKALLAADPERTVSLLAEELTGPDADAAADSLLALVRSDPALCPVLIEALDRPGARAGVEAVLLAAGDPAYVALALRAAATNDDAERLALTEMLERFDGAPEEALPLVIGLLDAESWRVQLAALRALDGFEQQPVAALPWLCQAARDPDHMLREMAIVRAARLGRGRGEILDLLVGLLEVPHPWVRRTALRAMRTWGSLARLAEPAVRMMGERDPVLRSDVELTLRVLRGQEP